jgi:hypothetical protein
MGLAPPKPCSLSDQAPAGRKSRAERAAHENVVVQIPDPGGATYMIARRNGVLRLNGVPGCRSYNQHDARCESAEDYRSFFGGGR